MSSGFTLQESMALLETPGSRSVFRHIRSLLEEGKQPDRFFPELCPHAYRAYLSGFLSCLPFSEALQLCSEVVSGEEAQRNEYVRGLFYPVMMLICTIAGITLFNEFCFPPLLSLLEGFHVSAEDYSLLRLLIRAAGILFLAVLLIAGCLAIFLKNPAGQIKAYVFLARHFPASFIVQYESADFIRFFLQCIRMKVPTKESIRILSAVQQRPVIRFLAGVMEQMFLTGETFRTAVEESWLDPSLIRFMKIAYYSFDMESMLEGYLEMSRQRARRQCIRITRTVQILSYLSIGIIVILIYQIMLLPMQLLAGI